MISNYPWIHIHDISQFLIGKPREFHPDDPRHTTYWRELKRWCIEGLWGEQENSNYRYMPGRLFFYGNFGKIIDTDEKEKVRRIITPRIDDIEWERSYNYLEAEGFSGWTEEANTTSNRRIHSIRKNYDPSSVTSDPVFFKSDGRFKDFIEPRESIRMLHTEPLGAPRYDNPTSNICEMGSRGGGKSYYYAIAGALYRICFDGIKYYTEANRRNPPSISVLVGSGRADKSSDFCSKIEAAMDQLATNPDCGAFGTIGDADYEPSPFYKDMKGTLKPNNKSNPWIHEYEVNINGRWVGGYGTKSKLFHVNYSPNKRDGAEAGAGGRYTDVFYEEVGLTELAIEAYNSNRATVTTGATQFGVQVFLGTSGNMDTVRPARQIFTHPKDFDCLSFPDVYEAGSPTGFFLPAAMTAREFKDSNGNTDIDKALDYYEKRKSKAAESEDARILRVERMNYPNVPSDMWQQESGSILPAREAEAREKELMRFNTYEKIGTPITLYWDKHHPRGVDYEINHNAQPFYDWPIRPKRDDFEGAVMIYDHPKEIRGQVPDDMYIVTHDPYVTDEMYRQGSLGAAHVWMSPKYWTEHMTTSPLVATYIGRPKNGKRIYYDNLEKLLAYYGNPVRGLWYEADRGDYCRDYFIRKKKAELLCLRPQFAQGDSATASMNVKLGFKVGNRVEKIQKLDDLSEFLKQDLDVMDNIIKVIHTLPCIFTVRQIRTYNLKENHDAISSILAFPLYKREMEHSRLNDLRGKNGGVKNPLSFLSNNRMMPHGAHQQTQR